MSEPKQMLIVRTDLKMGKGKIASQVAHASISAYLKAYKKDPKLCDEWITRQKKVVLKVDSKEEIIELSEEMKNILPCALIKDAGRTQIEPGSITALGVGPAREEDLNKYLSKLKLL